MENLPSPLNHPVLRADLPNYPLQLQLLQLTAVLIDGPIGSKTVLYSAFVEQLRTDTLIPRDREPCLAINPNGISLSPGHYLGRLSGSFINLPVYEVVCSISPIGGPTCISSHFVYKTLLCENGILNAYEVTVTAKVVAGCLVYEEGPFRLSYRAGCCDCGGPTPINIPNINNYPTSNKGISIPRGFYFNLYDNCLWFWTGLCWCLITCCACGSSSSSSPCVPGVCPACPDPPSAWTIPITGFNGNGTAFNRTWTFTPTDRSCVWADLTQMYQGVALDGEIEIVGGQLVVTLTYATATGIQSKAVFAGSITDCCCPVTLFLVSCSDEVFGGDQNSSECFICPSGETPIYYTANFTGFTEGYSAFNGARILTQIAPCNYRFQTSTQIIHLSLSGVPLTPPNNDIADANATLTMSIPNTSLTPVLMTFANYANSKITDCCSGLTLLFQDAFTPVAFSTTPPTVELDPTCGTPPASAPCPATLTAVPICCSGPGICGSSSSSGGGVGSSGGGGPSTIPCAEGLGPLNLTTSIPVCGTDWTGVGTVMGYDSNAHAFQTTAGPGTDPTIGFAIRLTCNDDGTYNIVPAQGPIVYYCAGFTPVYNIAPLNVSPLHVRATLTTDCCSQPDQVGGTFTVDITG